MYEKKIMMHAEIRQHALHSIQYSVIECVQRKICIFTMYV